MKVPAAQTAAVYNNNIHYFDKSTVMEANKHISVHDKSMVFFGSFKKKIQFAILHIIQRLL